MATYMVHESFIDGLMKKVAGIARKCNRYGCGFRFEVLGEQFVEVDGQGPQKFYMVEAEGTAKVEGWQFVATIQHESTGNVVRKALTDVEVPERYWYTKPVCEHCDTHRTRKNTYLVRNEKTGEYKQVGKACLQDYTGGISAEWAAYMASLRDVFEEVDGAGANGIRFEQHYFEPETFLAYTASAVEHCGYVKKYTDYVDHREYNENNTAELVADIYEHDMRHHRPSTKKVKYGINEKDENAVIIAHAALDWLLNEVTADTDYVRNLRVVASMQYIGRSHTGLLASLVPYYLRAMERVRIAKEKASMGPSEYVGTVGQRITVKVMDGRIVARWASDFGTTYVYQWRTPDGAVIVWKSSSCSFIAEKVDTITGTVKEHTEYNGVKQTVLARCKVHEVEDTPATAPAFPLNWV